MCNKINEQKDFERFIRNEVSKFLFNHPLQNGRIEESHEFLELMVDIAYKKHRLNILGIESINEEDEYEIFFETLSKYIHCEIDADLKDIANYLYVKANEYYEVIDHLYGSGQTIERC